MSIDSSSEWLEYDLNPFIVFNSEGRVVSYNKEAEYLLSNVEFDKLFELATTYANSTAGFKTTNINISLNNQTYYAITVGYNDDESIGIKLYKEVQSKQEKSFTNKKGTITNIFTLIELSKNSTITNTSIDISQSYDPTIPDIKIDVKNFLKLLNNIFTAVNSQNKISIKVNLKLGTYIKIENKKYPVLNLQMDIEDELTSEIFEYDKLSNICNIVPYLERNLIKLEIPLITK